MKKVFIITEFVSMPGEKANGRFRYIADLLVRNNIEVELITTNYSHRDKKHRIYEENPKCKYKFTMLDEPGYKKNVSLKRFYSHYIFSKNLKKYLREIQIKPDVIYCAVPTLSAAKVAAKYAKENNIKFIIDIQDLWPEAFKMVFNIPIISDIMFYPMKRMADYIYSSADDIIAVSETYLKRATDINSIAKNKLSVYLGTNLHYFDECKNKNKVTYDDDYIRIVYIGTLGHSYNIKDVIDAINLLKENDINNLKFVVMGDGPLKREFQEYAKKKGIDCEFKGMLNYDNMVGILCSCDIAVNPISHNAAQSIINKVGDYAAAGLPVINTQENEEYRNIVEKYEIGYNCINSDYKDMASKIEKIIENFEIKNKMGKNNRKLAEERFDRNKTYNYIIKTIEEE